MMSFLSFFFILLLLMVIYSWSGSLFLFLLCLFGNTLYGTVDAYIKNVKDMLINPAYLGATGEA